MGSSLESGPGFSICIISCFPMSRRQKLMIISYYAITECFVVLGI